MNHLNSVLVEGVIAIKPQYSENEKQCTFTIQSNRFIKEGSAIRKKVNVFSVLATGKLAEACSTKKKGRGVRVVGRMDNDEYDAVFIEAEQIQFSPEKSGKGA
jgi:single-stranded DNA-binding protein